MKNTVGFFFLLALTVVLAVSANADIKFPDYSIRKSPKCAVTWVRHHDVQSKLLCREDIKVISGSHDGVLSYGFEIESETIINQRRVERVDTVPEPVFSFISWAKKCAHSRECEIEDDLEDLFSIIGEIDLNNGAWKYQLSSANIEPVFGTVIFLFHVDQKILAIHSARNQSLLPEDVGIFGFFLISTSK